MLDPTPPPSPGESSLGLPSDDNEHTVVHTPGDITGPSFMQEFRLLSNLDSYGKQVVLEELGEPILDVDRWEIVLSPEEYLARFPNPLATVQLSARIPPHRKDNGSIFHDWLLLARANHQISVTSVV